MQLAHHQSSRCQGQKQELGAPQLPHVRTRTSNLLMENDHLQQILPFIVCAQL